ncbi:hypothetical protein NX059_011084 [Plenodomus lindquistii]|nr:hypothetical protein NX059_011084 [Plenodomus lindquistii]
MIYNYYLIADSAIEFHTATKERPKLGLAIGLLSTSKLINNEACEILHGKNAFRIFRHRGCISNKRSLPSALPWVKEVTISLLKCLRLRWKPEECFDEWILSHHDSVNINAILDTLTSGSHLETVNIAILAEYTLHQCHALGHCGTWRPAVWSNDDLLERIREMTNHKLNLRVRIVMVQSEDPEYKDWPRKGIEFYKEMLGV